MRRGKGKRALAGVLAAALCAGLFFLPASAAPEAVSYTHLTLPTILRV